MVITIGGQYGCGAKKVAVITAEALGYKLCADEIITKAVSEFGIDIKKETYEYYDESMGTGSISEIRAASSIKSLPMEGLVDVLIADTVPLDRRISESQRKVINDFADQGNCIILGRCADYYLEGRKDVIRVWGYNSFENCVKCITTSFGVSEKEAAKMIKKTDKRREDYYSYFTSRKWKDPSNYDLLLNIETLGVNGAVEAIKNIANMKGIGGDSYPEITGKKV